MVIQFFRVLHRAKALRRVVAATAILGAACSGGQVSAQDPLDTPLSLKRNLAIDGDFNETSFPTGASLLAAPQKFGPWTVDLGSVGLHADEFDTPDGLGNVIDLNGTRSGSLYQPISTVPGKKYTVSFLVSGNWNTNPDRPRALSLRFGSQKISWSLNRPAGWSKTNMQWQVRSAEFTATSKTSGLRFSSDSPGIPDGAVICRVDVRATAEFPGPLDSIPVPLPANLADYVLDQEKAIALGKALFWDMQVGSDGKTACASCHWHAGADVRTQNTLNPGAPGSAFGPQSAESQQLRAKAVSKFRGPNKVVTSQDYPFHRVKNPLKPADYPGDLTPDNPVIFDTQEGTGSQGVIAKNFLGIVEGSPVDAGVVRIDPIFQVHGANVRQVTGRNAPTTINAVFFDRSFWDGRANHYFNGVNEFGDLDPDAKVLRATASGELEPVRILLDNAALASQAVGPVNSSVEMSWLARSFPEVGRKMFSLRPLALQKIAASDSVLGNYRHSSGQGLDAAKASYAALIRAAFRPEWWSSKKKITADGYTQMEANFSLYWGLALMMYQSTLVSDETPFDHFARGNETALSPQAKEGLKIFLGAGKCINCHGGPEFAGATVSKLRGALGNGGLIEFMPMEKGTAYYDGGFYNIGVRPTHEDLGLGARHPQFGPLSYSRQEQAGRNPDPAKSIRPDARVTVDGAFKSPTLRNIELTGPYMHNGGMKSLEEVVQFYTRGADFFHANLEDLDPDVNGIPELQENPAGVAAVVEFMLHLTDPRVKYRAAPFDHPEIFLPNGHQMPVASTATDKLLRLPETGAEGGAPLKSFEHALEYGLKLDEKDTAPTTPGNEEPVEEEPVGEEPVDEEPVDEEPVGEEPVVEEPVDEEPVDEEPVGEEPVGEEPVEEEPVDEEAVDEEPVDEEPVDEEPVDEEPVDEEPVDEEPVDEEPVDEEPVDEEPVEEEPVGEEPAEEEPVGEEPVGEEPVGEEPVDEEPVDEEPVDEEPVDEEPVDEEPVDEEPVDEEPVDEEPVDEEPVDEEPVDEEPVDEEPVDEEPVDEEPVEEEGEDDAEADDEELESDDAPDDKRKNRNRGKTTEPVGSRKLIRTSLSKDEASLRDPVGSRNQRAVK
jgi:cytochrome c peroxidase